MNYAWNNANMTELDYSTIGNQVEPCCGVLFYVKMNRPQPLGHIALVAGAHCTRAAAHGAADAYGNFSGSEFCGVRGRIRIL